MDERPNYNADRNWSAYEQDSHIGNTSPMRPVPPAASQQPPAPQYGKHAAWPQGQPVPQGQPHGYGQPQPYGQPIPQAQPQGYAKPQVYGQPIPQGQPVAQNQPQAYGQPQAYNQPMPQGQPRAYGQPQAYGYPQGNAYGYPLNQRPPETYTRDPRMDYDEFFYGRDTYVEQPQKRHGCGCGCGTFIALLLAVALVFTMWPTLLPSQDIIRGTQIDQVRDWISDTFGFEWPMPSEEEIEAIYNQETRADAGYLAEEPRTELLSVADSLHYYRETLDDHAKSVYDALEEGILAQDESIYLPMGTTQGELQTCWQFVLYDHPGVFNLPDDAHVSYWSWGGSVSYLEPDYKFDAETTQKLSDEYEQLAMDLPLLADTQAATMENICAWVADNTEYVNTDNDQYIDSVFTNRQSVCAGYAKAVQYLALRHGIPCVYITGTAEDFLGTGGSHAWLAAYVDGEVRYYDPTWFDQRGFHATQFLGMNLVEISADHTADYPQLLPR